MQKRRKYIKFNIKEKEKIIKDYYTLLENAPKLTKKDLAKILNVPYNTLRDWIKNQNKIIDKKSYSNNNIFDEKILTNFSQELTYKLNMLQTSLIIIQRSLNKLLYLYQKDLCNMSEEEITINLHKIYSKINITEKFNEK